MLDFCQDDLPPRARLTGLVPYGGCTDVSNAGCMAKAGCMSKAGCCVCMAANAGRAAGWTEHAPAPDEPGGGPTEHVVGAEAGRMNPLEAPLDTAPEHE